MEKKTILLRDNAKIFRRPVLESFGAQVNLVENELLRVLVFSLIPPK